MEIQQVLNDLGYTPNEVVIYLALLKLGESTASEIAKKTKLPRSTIQDLMPAMQIKGIVECYLKKRKKYWVACDPSIFEIKLKERERNLKQILPELKKMSPGKKESSHIRLYTGIAEIKKLCDDIVNTKQNVKCALFWDRWVELFGIKTAMEMLNNCRKNFLKVQILTTTTPLTLKLQQNLADGHHTVRFLPEPSHMRNASFLYGNKMAFIILQHEPMGVVINNEDMSYSYGSFFDILWNNSTSEPKVR